MVLDFAWTRFSSNSLSIQGTEMLSGRSAFKMGEDLDFSDFSLNFSLVHFSCATLIDNGKSQAKVLMFRRESLGKRVQFLLEFVLKIVRLN